MNKLGFLFFLSVLGCIKLERLEERDKVFSYDDFRKLVKKEDIAEYLSRNEYDFEQELEKGRDILHILIQNDMEAEVLVLLDKLNVLKEEERVKFLPIGDGKEALFLVVDKLWVKSAMKILDMYSKEVKQVRLGFGQRLNFNLLGRAVMNKNMQSLLLVLDLRRKYAKEIEDEYARSCTFKINKKLSESLEKTYDLVTVRKADKASEVDKSIGEDSIFVTFLKECLKKKGIKGEVSVEEFLSNLEEEEKKEALIISSCLGDEKVLSYLLNLGVKQDEVDENGNTALIDSSYYGRKEVAGVLIEKGVAIDLAAKDGETSLYLASENGHKEVVKLLIEKGAAIDLGNKKGETPLWAASSQGHKEAVELLLSKGASIDLVNIYGITPLYIASRNGHKEVVELLLKNGAVIDLAEKFYGVTPFSVAIHSGHKEVVELFINKGTAIDLSNHNGITPLCMASQQGHKEVVELFINKGAAIDLGNKKGETPLYIASCNGHKEVVELFLEKGAAIDLADQDGRTPLYIASAKGHKEIVELLIEKGAAIDSEQKNGSTPLYGASCNGRKEVVELLLEKGVSIDLGNNNGTTPLCIASQSGHKEVVELLLEKGAAIDLGNKKGETPLFIAVQNGDIEILRLLLRKDSDVNKIKSNGDNLIKLALDNFKTVIIEELISTCFVESKGIVLSSKSLRVDEKILNSFQMRISKSEWSDIRIPVIGRLGLQLTNDYPSLNLAKIYRILNEIYIEQFVQAFESDWQKSSSGEFFEIIDKIRNLKEINKREIEKIDSIIPDSSVRSRYEIIDFLNKLFDTRSVLKENPIYDEFINSREVILNRRVKAGYYKDYTILMLEILKGDLDKVSDKVKDFIKKGSDVNTTDQSGNSCLMLAIRKNLKEVVELLINNGADINAVNKIGENALMVAIEGNLFDIVKRLAHLTDMNHEDIFKNTALMLAIKKIMRINPNSGGSEKRVRDIEEIVDILIKRGAKVTQEVIDLLEEKKGDEVVEKFRLRLARIFKLDC